MIPSNTASPALQAAIALYNTGNYVGAWTALAKAANLGASLAK
jgi:hypothetical protein